MFYLIGLGIGDPKDITVKGLEILRKCDRVYLEAYTSILDCGTEGLEDFYQRKLIVADRDFVESRADEILSGAEEQDVALLVVGDPFGATTHTDIIIRAKEKGVKYNVVHNASILNAIGCCGLQLYSFGETVSIPYWSEEWQPDSFFDKIVSNYRRNLHTLCLLDLKVKEPTPETLTKKKREFMPPKFMTVNEAASQICAIIKKSKQTEISDNTICVGLARVGCDTQKIVMSTISEIVNVDLGKPLHTLIIPGPTLHPVEEEYIKQFKV